MNKPSILALAALTLLALASCTDTTKTADGGAGKGGAQNADSHVVATAFAAGDSSADSFVALASSETGLEFDNNVSNPQVLLDQIAAQAGLASGDFDNDGDLDIYVAGIEQPNRLYRNEGGFRFEDVTAAAGADIALEGEFCAGAMFVDVDGDGNLDLYVFTRGSFNRLYIGDGSGGFTDETEARGAGVGNTCVTVAALDIEGDGDLDLYVANNRMGRESMASQMDSDIQGSFRIDQNTGRYIMTGAAAEFYYFDELNKARVKPDDDQLLINDGSGHFDNGIADAGMDHIGWTLMALAGDYNEDGHTDLYLAGDMETPDYYYINNGHGFFTDQSRTMLRRTPYFSMGADHGDLDGDGLLDIFVGDMAAADYKDGKIQSGDMYQYRQELINFMPQQNMRNCLFLNRGFGWMSEVAELAGVKASEWTWSCRIADLNCSSTPELFATNGYTMRFSVDVDAMNEAAALSAAGATDEELEQHALSFGTLPRQDVLFTADTPLHYKKPADNWGIVGESISCGTSIQDYDGDGDLDIITNRTNDKLGVWRNDKQCGNRLTIDLRQPGSNWQAVGAKLKAYAGTKVIASEVTLARGYSSAESARVHIGTGEHTSLTRLEIIWPDGKLQVERDLPCGSHYVISRRDDLEDWTPPAQQGIYTREDFAWQRKEADTLAQEFDEEPLLPWQRSTLGGGLGVADFDLDGRMDIYFAGAAGQTGRLYMGAEGGFAASSLMEGSIPAEVEEMGVLCFDANGDDRPDMLVTAGGNEAGGDTTLYRNWLVLNTEEGMQSGWISTSEVSSGSACSADIDHDGDLDVFIAGRLKPHRYLSPVPSELLVNEGNLNFVDGAASLPEGGISGCISDACFADVDNDGWQDLLTCDEYGPVRLYRNVDGRLQAGIDIAPHGIWTSLTVADTDNDGDLDIVAGNQGLNTKYKADNEHAMTLFAGEFNGDGRRQLVEAKQKGEQEFLPGRGRSCSGYAMPQTVAERFPKWHDFANASFNEIYGDPQEIQEHYYANELSSMLLVNDGKGGFTAQQLPLAAQYSIAFGCSAGDFDNDGDIDLLQADNYYATQPETGRWNAGYGQLLDGNGSGGFSSVEPGRSGIYIFTDGRGVQAFDSNGDGLLELVLSVAYASPVVLRRNPQEQSGTGLAVNLVGKDGNRWAVGSRATLELDNGSVLLREQQAGSGYLSSSLAPLHFGIPAGSKPVKLTVRWADGTEASVSEFDGSGKVTVLQY
ncbi:VCBS repeat-containing protein [bacterium]|nr:VCBS repeat-containing protein [bacterium]